VTARTNAVRNSLVKNNYDSCDYNAVAYISRPALSRVTRFQAHYGLWHRVTFHARITVGARTRTWISADGLSIDVDRSGRSRLCVMLSWKRSNDHSLHCLSAYTLCLKKPTSTINMAHCHQYKILSNYFWYRQPLFNSQLSTLKVFNLA